MALLLGLTVACSGEDKTDTDTTATTSDTSSVQVDYGIPTTYDTDTSTN